MSRYWTCKHVERARGFRGTRLPDETYALDPAKEPWRFWRFVVPARLAVIEGNT